MSAAIRSEVRGFVGDGVLTPQLLLYLRKSVGDVLNFERKEGASASRVCDAFQNFVAPGFGAANVRADGIDNRIGALCHLDSFFPGHATLIIFAIRQQNDRPSRGDGRSFLIFEQLVTAGAVKSVVQRRAATRAQIAHPFGKAVTIAGEILRDFRGRVEAKNECEVFPGTNNLREKLNGGLLLKGKAIPD